MLRTVNARMELAPPTQNCSAVGHLRRIAVGMRYAETETADYPVVTRHLTAVDKLRRGLEELRERHAEQLLLAPDARGTPQCPAHIAGLL